MPECTAMDYNDQTAINLRLLCSIYLGASKLSSSLTRKLQLAKNTRYTPDRQSITEEDSVSGFDSARSSISNSDSFVNGRDMFYSVTSETEYEPTQE